MNFVSTQVGEDAVAIVVRREVVAGGLRSLDRAGLQRLFGGPDLGVFVYDKEPGRGTREVLDKFLYGPEGKAPPPPSSPRYAVVGGNEEGRTKVLTTPGSVTPLSVAFIVGYPKLAALAVGGIAPTADNVRTRRYPLSRPLFLVTNGPPSGDAKRFIDYVLSPAGQANVHLHGYLTLAEIRRR